MFSTIKEEDGQKTSLKKREARVCKIWRAKFIVKEKLTDLIDDVKLKEEEICKNLFIFVISHNR